MVRKFSAVCCVLGAFVLRAWCFCAVCLVLLFCVLGVVSLVLYVVPYAVMQVLLRLFHATAEHLHILMAGVAEPETCRLRVSRRF